MLVSCFCFTAPPTTEIYTLSLHDALPISRRQVRVVPHGREHAAGDLPGDGVLVEAAVRVRPGLDRDDLEGRRGGEAEELDRKSTRLNSSHMSISYAVFCLKKKK